MSAASFSPGEEWTAAAGHVHSLPWTRCLSRSRLIVAGSRGGSSSRSSNSGRGGGREGFSPAASPAAACAHPASSSTAGWRQPPPHGFFCTQREPGGQCTDFCSVD